MFIETPNPIKFSLDPIYIPLCFRQKSKNKIILNVNVSYSGARINSIDIMFDVFNVNGKKSCRNFSLYGFLSIIRSLKQDLPLTYMWALRLNHLFGPRSMHAGSYKQTKYLSIQRNKSYKAIDIDFFDMYNNSYDYNCSLLKKANLYKDDGYVYGSDYTILKPKFEDLVLLGMLILKAKKQ